MVSNSRKAELPACGLQPISEPKLRSKRFSTPIWADLEFRAAGDRARRPGNLAHRRHPCLAISQVPGTSLIIDLSNERRIVFTI